MIVKLCNICGRIYPSDLAIRFCLHCGGLLAPDHLKLYVPCPICGTITLPEAHFCHYCGTAVDVRQAPEEESIRVKTAESPAPSDSVSPSESNPIIEFSHELDLILSDTVATESPDVGYDIEENTNTCPICGQPLASGTSDCPNCQSINVNLKSDHLNTPIDENTDTSSIPWSDSFSDLFSGDAFREIFVSGGLNLDDIPSPTQTAQPPKPAAKKVKPALFTDSSEPAVGPILPQAQLHPDVVAAELAKPKTETEITGIEKPGKGTEPTTRLKFGLPPIPWWGWSGVAFILLLILVYFVFIPLFNSHTPEKLSKPQPSTETTTRTPQTAPLPSVPTPLQGESLVILQPNVPLLASPESNAEYAGGALSSKTKVTLMQEKDDYIQVKTEDGTEGWISRQLKGKPSFVAETDYKKRKLAAPTIIHPRSSQTFNVFPREVTVRWGTVSDPETVTYTLVAQYGNGKGTWWDVSHRQLSGNSAKIEFPGAYPARVMVTATTSDGISSSSGWVNFSFTQ